MRAFGRNLPGLLHDAAAQRVDVFVGAVEHHRFERGDVLVQFADRALALTQLRRQQTHARFVAAVLQFEQRDLRGRQSFGGLRAQAARGGERRGFALVRGWSLRGIR